MALLQTAPHMRTIICLVTESQSSLSQDLLNDSLWQGIYWINGFQIALLHQGQPSDAKECMEYIYHILWPV